LINVYRNNVVVAELLNLNKSTVGRYIKYNKIFMWKSKQCILKKSLLVVNE